MDEHAATDFGRLSDAVPVKRSRREDAAVAGTPWIYQFCQKLIQPKQKRRRSSELTGSVCDTASRCVDRLEDRTLLSATSVLLGSQLRIITDADESVSFQQNALNPDQVEVLINGQVFEGAPAVQVSQIESLLITTGELDNTVDLTPLTVGTYFNLTDIRVETGDGDDTVIASPEFAAFVLSGDGNDTLTGSSLNDTLLSGNGDDSLAGGAGDDSIDAGDGEDFVQGEDGNDSIQGGDGSDTIDGGLGDDSLRGHDGADSIDGGEGNDLILMDLGNDSGTGGAGSDTVFGGGGADTLDGAAGDDVVNGQGGPDSIAGSEGNDSLYGSGSADTILGGDGDDFARGDAGTDILIGGDGDDTQYGGGGSDLVNGQAGADHSFGNAGQDTILGGDGADTLNGGTGNDLIDNSLLLRPPITVNNVSQDEGSGNISTDFVFTVSLPAPAIAPVMVDFETVDDSAVAGEDYVATSGSLVFDVGVQDLMVTVQVIGDDIEESDEIFFLEISNAVGGTLNNMRGFGQIVNDDGVIAAGLNVTPTVDSGVITTAVVGTSSGITVTGMTLSANTGFLTEMSSGTFTAGPGAAYGLSGNGIILSTGDVADYGDGPATGFGGSTTFGVPATPAQELLLDPVTGGQFDHNDVTQLDINFDLQAGFDTLFFELVFGSEEFPTFVGTSFIDAFAIYLNGTNIATFNGEPVNVNHPDFAAITGTELNGVLAPGGDPLLTFAAQLTDGQTNNTITFIIADSADTSLDSTVYIASLGGTVPGVLPPPPPALLDVDVVPTTIVGGSGDDTINGGGSDDFIDAGNGDDTILGLQGDDRIFGGGGDDTIDAGEGQDTLIGNGGDDVLDGGAGDDVVLWREKDFRVTVAGSGGQDTVLVQGSLAADTFAVGSSGSDLTVDLGAARLQIESTVESVVFNQGNGDDVVTVGDLSAAGLTELRFNGENGDDLIDLSSATLLGNVVLLADGGDGNDILLGSDADELLTGGNGDDSISAGAGDDTLQGGEGADLLNGQAGDDILQGDAGNDVITGGDGDDSMSGGADNDTLDGEQGADTLRGNFGDDSLNGSFGDDSLNGGLGRDALIGGSGNDTLDGGNHNDTLIGNSGRDRLIGNHGDDFVRGGTADDTINGGDGFDTLNGDDGDDLIGGGDGNDQISGGNGLDTLTGGNADDTLLGGGAPDLLFGDQGADVLKGNGGADRGNPGEGENPVPESVLVDDSLLIDQSLLDDLNGL